MVRSLSPRERAALELLLSAEFSGVSELRAQAETVSADRDGMVLDLVVDQALPTANVTRRNPVEAVVDGDGYDGGLILFVDEGRLSALEYWWVTDDRPDGFPPLSAIGSPVIPA